MALDVDLDIGPRTRLRDLPRLLHAGDDVDEELRVGEGALDGLDSAPLRISENI